MKIREHRLLSEILWCCSIFSMLFILIANTKAADIIEKNVSKIDQVERGILQEATASWWGYNPEDSTPNLQAALDSKAPKIIIDRQTGPWITKTLTIPSDKEIILAEGVEILAKKGEFHALGDSLLRIDQVNNVVVRGEGKGAILRMRKSDYHTEAYKKSEWRHGVNIKSAHRIVIENISIISTGGDGIYLGVSKKGVPCSNIIIRKVVCDDNNRQGISVISAKNLLIEDTVMKNTKGTAPESGIDFEPNSKTEKLVNCIMRRCVCENNAGDGYQFYLPNLEQSSGPTSIILDNCISKNNKRSGFSLTVGNGPTKSLYGHIVVENFVSENDGNCIQIRSKAANALKLIFANVTLIVKDNEKEQTQNKKKVISRSPILISSRILDVDPIGNIVFDKLFVRYTGEQPVLGFFDSTANGYGLRGIIGQITVDNNGKKTVHVLNDEWCHKNYPIKNLRKISAIKPEDVSQIPFASTIEKGSAIRPRAQADYLFYAEKDQKVELVLQQGPVGQTLPSKANLVITSPSGKKASLPLTASFKEKTKLSWTAKESGIHHLTADLGQKYSLSLIQSNVPTTFSTYPQLGLVYSPGTFYFDVPKGTKEFALKAIGENMERIKITLFDPKGKEVWNKDNIEGLEIYYSETNKEPEPGLWKIKLERPSQGVLEDCSLILLGIPPYILGAPEIKYFPATPK